MKVELLGSYASDLDVANAAMVSGGSRLSDPSDPKVEGVIRKLLTSQPPHGSPFAHTYFRFHVAVPIFVQRDWFRHTVGSAYNEVSTRWQSMDDLGIYDPELLREQVGKSWEYRFEDFAPLTASVDEKLRHWWRKRYLVRSQERAVSRYKRMLKRGYAREQAMATLPMGTYTEFWWSTNARAIMNFCALRNHPAARKEIREAAVHVETLWACEMPRTNWLWNEAGRPTP